MKWLPKKLETAILAPGLTVGTILALVCGNTLLGFIGAFTVVISFSRLIELYLNNIFPEKNLWSPNQKENYVVLDGDGSDKTVALAIENDTLIVAVLRGHRWVVKVKNPLGHMNLWKLKHLIEEETEKRNKPTVMASNDQTNWAQENSK